MGVQRRLSGDLNSLPFTFEWRGLVGASGLLVGCIVRSIRRIVGEGVSLGWEGRGCQAKLSGWKSRWLGRSKKERSSLFRARPSRLGLGEGGARKDGAGGGCRIRTDRGSKFPGWVGGIQGGKGLKKGRKLGGGGG